MLYPTEEFSVESLENISFCEICQLSYLIRKAGPQYASVHPHHLATLNNQRTIVVATTPRVYYWSDGPEDELWMDGEYRFGPDSEYNVRYEAGPFRTKEEAYDFARGDCLIYLFQDIFPKRKMMLEGWKEVSPNTFLQGDPLPFRLLIATGFGRSTSIGGDETGMQERVTDMVRILAEDGITTMWYEIPYPVLIRLPPL